MIRLVLMGMLLASAFSVVFLAHSSHMQYGALARLLNEYDELRYTRSQLQIEYAALTQPGKIRAQVKALHLVSPTGDAYQTWP